MIPHGMQITANQQLTREYLACKQWGNIRRRQPTTAYSHTMKTTTIDAAEHPATTKAEGDPKAINFIKHITLLTFSCFFFFPNKDLIIMIMKN